jgi:hypothetical protein
LRFEKAAKVFTKESLLLLLLRRRRPAVGPSLA